mmetsp:Transcript_168341/g.540853  ORF Transcript_168341/g.540853 Transcript_168341/m.540853 type:complete len:304 (+) Transcript_168341:114-1025(+)
MRARAQSNISSSASFLADSFGFSNWLRRISTRDLRAGFDSVPAASLCAAAFGLIESLGLTGDWGFSSGCLAASGSVFGDSGCAAGAGLAAALAGSRAGGAKALGAAEGDEEDEDEAVAAVAPTATAAAAPETAGTVAEDSSVVPWLKKSKVGAPDRAATDRAPSTAPWAALVTNPAASVVASFIVPAAPLSRKSCTVEVHPSFSQAAPAAAPSVPLWIGESRSMSGFAKFTAPEPTLLAAPLTRSTASQVASLKAPTAPFSRKSCIVALTSFLIVSSSHGWAAAEPSALPSATGVSKSMSGLA